MARSSQELSYDIVQGTLPTRRSQSHHALGRLPLRMSPLQRYRVLCPIGKPHRNSHDGGGHDLGEASVHGALPRRIEEHIAFPLGARDSEGEAVFHIPLPSCIARLNRRACGIAVSFCTSPHNRFKKSATQLHQNIAQDVLLQERMMRHRIAEPIKVGPDACPRHQISISHS